MFGSDWREAPTVDVTVRGTPLRTVAPGRIDAVRGRFQTCPSGVGSDRSLRGGMRAVARCLTSTNPLIP
jgi:hypothetical protein